MKGDLHRGHSAFWLCQSAMHCQQNTWPQGVAVGNVRAPKHSAHFLCCGTSPTSAALGTSCSGAASSSPKSCHVTMHTYPFTLLPGSSYALQHPKNLHCKSKAEQENIATTHSLRADHMSAQRPSIGNDSTQLSGQVARKRRGRPEEQQLLAGLCLCGRPRLCSCRGARSGPTRRSGWTAPRSLR